jgi:hypothetical protein
MLLFELGVIVIMTLVVGTFTPALQQLLPWGRAWYRMQQRRLASGMRALEEAARRQEIGETRARADVASSYRSSLCADAPIASESWLDRLRARRTARVRLALEEALRVEGIEEERAERI